MLSINPFEEYMMMRDNASRDNVTRTHIEPAQELLDVFNERAQELDRDPLVSDLNDIRFFFETKVLPVNVVSQRDALVACTVSGTDMLIPFVCEIWFYVCDSLNIRRVYPCFTKFEEFFLDDNFVIAIEMPESDIPAAAKYICIYLNVKTKMIGYFVYEPHPGCPQISEYRGEILYGSGRINECATLRDFAVELFNRLS